MEQDGFDIASLIAESFEVSCGCSAPCARNDDETLVDEGGDNVSCIQRSIRAEYEDSLEPLAGLLRDARPGRGRQPSVPPPASGAMQPAVPDVDD